MTLSIFGLGTRLLGPFDFTNAPLATFLEEKEESRDPGYE